METMRLYEIYSPLNNELLMEKLGPAGKFLGSIAMAGGMLLSQFAGACDANIQDMVNVVNKHPEITKQTNGNFEHDKEVICKFLDSTKNDATAQTDVTTADISNGEVQNQHSASNMSAEMLKTTAVKDAKQFIELYLKSSDNNARKIANHLNIEIKPHPAGANFVSQQAQLAAQTYELRRQQLEKQGIQIPVLPYENHRSTSAQDMLEFIQNFR